MEPGTRREASLTEGAGGRAQPNGARARLGRGGQEGTLLPWPPWVMEPLRRRGPSRDLPDAWGARGTLFPGVKPERRLVSREVGSSNPEPTPRSPASSLEWLSSITGALPLPTAKGRMLYVQLEKEKRGTKQARR